CPFLPRLHRGAPAAGTLDERAAATVGRGRRAARPGACRPGASLGAVLLVGSVRPQDPVRRSSHGRLHGPHRGGGSGRGRLRGALPHSRRTSGGCAGDRQGPSVRSVAAQTGPARLTEVRGRAVSDRPVGASPVGTDV